MGDDTHRRLLNETRHGSRRHRGCVGQCGKISEMNTGKDRPHRARHAVLDAVVLLIATLLIWYTLFSHPAGGR